MVGLILFSRIRHGRDVYRIAASFDTYTSGDGEGLCIIGIDYTACYAGIQVESGDVVPGIAGRGGVQAAEMEYRRCDGSGSEGGEIIVQRAIENDPDRSGHVRNTTAPQKGEAHRSAGKRL